MTYQEILKTNLKRRTSLNPRYSLRAFALFLGMAPSKLSEIFSGKKGLSISRALVFCQRLKLKSPDRDFFLLSVQAQHARLKSQKEDAQKKLKELHLSSQLEKSKTQQRNAWYFGAYKAVKEAHLKVGALQKTLDLTALQIENAERFNKRIQKLHPEREHMAYDPASLFKKLSDDFTSGSLASLDAEFAFLTEEQAKNLEGLIRDKILSYALENQSENDSKLYLYFTGHSELCTKEDLC